MAPLAWSRRRPSRLAASALAACALAVAAGDAAAVRRGQVLAAARAEEDWRTEFDAVCARTQDAMALPSDELRELVRRCDALRPRVDALDSSQRKVYGKRLQLCRDLYAFVLESRAAEPR